MSVPKRRLGRPSEGFGLGPSRCPSNGGRSIAANVARRLPRQLSTDQTVVQSRATSAAAARRSEGVPGGTIDFRKFSERRVHARLGFIKTANLLLLTTLIR